MALYRTGLYVKNHSVEKVQVAKTPIASFNGNVTGLYIPELIAYITARQSGSGTPAPDNIRPIIGVSECNVVRCGKNIWSYGDVSGTKRVAVEVDIKAGTYTVSANVTSSDTDFDMNLILFYYEDRTTESVLINRGTRQNATFTLTKDVTSINFYASRSNAQSDGDTFSFTDIQLEVGSTATAYEAYNGNTYNIQLGDTCYGGVLDVTTGVLTVTWGIADLGSLNYQYNSNTNIFTSTNMTNFREPTSTGQRRTGFLCDIYPPSSTVTINANMDDKSMLRLSGQINIRNTSYTSEQSFKSAMSGHQIVYSLATPITVQLSPAQVEQLLGTNNVWADTGDVEVKFYNVIR